MSEYLVYIARALDNSWAAVAESEVHARQLIAEREPDIVKQNGYQILVEPLGSVMADKIPGIKRGLRHKLVKWDGEGPIPEDAATQPQKYVQVAEVWEGGDGTDPKIIYTRS